MGGETPRIIARHPEPSASGVAIDTWPWVQFSVPIDPDSTVNPDRFIVMDTNTMTPVDGTVACSGDYTVVEFIPTVGFSRDTEYMVTVIGGEGGINDGDEPFPNYLPHSDTWWFTTGPSASGTPTTAISGIPETSGVVPSGYVYVASTSPADYATSVSVDTRRITIEFNMDPSGWEDPSGIVPVSSYITVESRHALGYEWSTADPWITYALITQSGRYVTIESYASGTHLDSSGNIVEVSGTLNPMRHNAEYVVTVASGVQASGYEDMPRNYTFSFLTDLNPRYATTTNIRLEVGPFIETIPDATIDRTILKNSLDAARIWNAGASGGQFGELQGTEGDSVPWCVENYVRVATVRDLLRDEILARSSEAGNKSLGDFSVDFNSDDIMGAVGPIYKDYDLSAEKLAGSLAPPPGIFRRSKYNPSLLICVSMMPLPS